MGPENCSPRLKGFAGGGGFFERSAYIAFREKVHRCILEIKCIIMRAQPILTNVLYTILGTSGVCVAWGVGVFQWARGGWWVSHGCVFFSIFRERGCRAIVLFLGGGGIGVVGLLYGGCYWIRFAYIQVQSVAWRRGGRGGEAGAARRARRCGSAAIATPPPRGQY